MNAPETAGPEHRQLPPDTGGAADGDAGRGEVRPESARVVRVLHRWAIERVPAAPKEDRGTFTGGYTLRRIKRGLYLYIPDKGDPLTFTRPNGERIAIAEMILTTDLGSTPRLVWWIPGLAPNDLERPSIVHDALYERHHAGGKENFAEANLILGEACRAEGYSRFLSWLVRRCCDWFGRRIWNAGGRVDFEIKKGRLL